MRGNRNTVPAKKSAPGKGDDTRLSIILLSAGMGKRMKSYGPKALFNIGSLTLVEQQLQTLWTTFPCSDIIMVTGFGSKKIRLALQDKYPIRFVYNPLWELTNVMFSVSLGLFPCVSKQVLIIHGDLYFNTDAIHDITSNGSAALVDTTNKFKNEEVGLVYNTHDYHITNFAYGLPTKWGQMVYLEDRELKLFEKTAHFHEESQKWFLYEGLNEVIKNKGQLRAHLPNGLKLIDIDGAKDLIEANNNGQG
jgi:choline kinase